MWAVGGRPADFLRTRADFPRTESGSSGLSPWVDSQGFGPGSVGGQDRNWVIAAAHYAGVHEPSPRHEACAFLRTCVAHLSNSRVHCCAGVSGDASEHPCRPQVADSDRTHVRRRSSELGVRRRPCPPRIGGDQSDQLAVIRSDGLAHHSAGSGVPLAILMGSGAVWWSSQQIAVYLPAGEMGRTLITLLGTCVLEDVLSRLGC